MARKRHGGGWEHRGAQPEYVLPVQGDASRLLTNPFSWVFVARARFHWSCQGIVSPLSSSGVGGNLCPGDTLGLDLSGLWAVGQRDFGVIKWKTSERSTGKMENHRKNPQAKWKTLERIQRQNGKPEKGSTGKKGNLRKDPQVKIPLVLGVFLAVIML